MKVFQLILMLILIGSSMALSLKQKWDEYKHNFDKNYKPEEDAKRFLIFKSKLEEFTAANGEKAPWTDGINDFTDLTATELERINYGVDLPP